MFLFLTGILRIFLLKSNINLDIWEYIYYNYVRKGVLLYAMPVHIQEF